MGVRIVPAEEGIAEAVRRLRAGKLVVFPTETVYGLGADARNPEAVARIFAAKGRPATNPLIVHIADIAAAAALTTDWSGRAEQIAERFWPGPLTLVVPTDTKSLVPPIVTAGGETVGLRIPSHPIARLLLQESGLVLAAPSANRSEEISPTTAAHVALSLGPHVDDLLILDGGPCEVGIESTVVDVTVDPPRILRPGMISQEMLESVGAFARPSSGGTAEGIARSPGQMLRHYAPRIPLALLRSDQITDSGGVERTGLLSIAGAVQEGERFAKSIEMPADAAGYAARLYFALWELDQADIERIIVVEPPAGGEWEAIRDRLRRAAAPKTEETGETGE